MTGAARIFAALAVVAAAIGLLVVRRAPPSAPPPGAPRPVGTAAPLHDGAASAARPAGAEITPEETTLPGDESFRLLVFTVPLAGARFRILDLGMTRDLERALAESGASLVVNAGFFDVAERPEGLSISEGVELSPRSDTLGGGVVSVAGARAALAPAEGFLAPAGTDFAVQARPRLVVDGKSVIARDDGKAAERTALCLRDQGRTLEVIVARGAVAGRGPTLALLADMLVSRGCSGALNLDGGPSTGITWRQASHAGPTVDGARLLAPRGPLRQAIAVWVSTSEE